MGDDDRQLKYIKTGMDFTKTVTTRILENLEGQEREEQLDHMRGIMLDYLLMEHEYDTAKKVIGRLKKGIEADNAEMNRDIEEEYLVAYEKELTQIGKKKEDFSEDPRYIELEMKIGADASTGQDEELAMTQTTDHIPKDQWTKKEIQQPVKNRSCGHVYEKAIVEKNLQRSGRTALKCPYVGCSNGNIRKEDLLPDQDLIKKINKKRRGH